MSRKRSNSHDTGEWPLAIPLCRNLSGRIDQPSSSSRPNTGSKSVRYTASFGQAFTQALQAVGANPIAIPSPEIYNAMQRGTVSFGATQVTGELMMSDTGVSAEDLPCRITLRA